MMNYVFPIMLIFSFFSAMITGRMENLSSAVISGAQQATELLFRLLSMLCLWGGIMEIADASGVTELISRILTPVIGLLFPRVRRDKYIMQSISMNITANILGLGNAATPLGLEAMRRLQTVNDTPKTASDEMIVFVVMNTAAMHIIPTTVATLRGQYGSASPMEIMPASFLTSFSALAAAICVAKVGNVLKRRREG